MEKKRILTGDRPTGNLHIGHYFGSLQNRIKFQDEYETFILVADIQALTDNFNDPQKVRKNVREITMDNIACGIDPKKSTFVIQSLVPAIAELTILYSNLVTVATLERNPTVKAELKQKEQLFKGNITYGFLGYPVSQAADITAFDADVVPVGEDQLPMIEQTREIVRKFNKIYGKTLKEPKGILSDVTRLPGLDGNKMSKSLDNAIYLIDSPETVSKKIMKAITDPGKIKLNDAGNPSICTIFKYHELFSDATNLKQIEKECISGKRGCVVCKKELITKINTFLKPIQEKRKYYEDHPKIVDEILFEGTKKANIITQKVLNNVKEKMCIKYF